MTGSAWPPQLVTEFIDSDPRFERVPADPTYAVRIVEQVCAEECDLALYAASRSRWSKANTLTYDAARKSVEALLLTSGRRVRSVAGAHAAVTEVVRRWLVRQEPPGPRIAEKFAASRKARHDDEYPHPNALPRTDSELRALAQDNVRLVDLVRSVLGLEPREDLVPTEANIRAFLAEPPT
jgi:hypothetical protein